MVKFQILIENYFSNSQKKIDFVLLHVYTVLFNVCIWIDEKPVCYLPQSLH